MKKEIPTVDELQLFREKLVVWYRHNHRKLPWRESRNPYHIWVSEVMLQQTQVATVIPYYLRFVEQFPNIRALAIADLQTVLKGWEGMGYYARARNLHRAAQIVATDSGGEIPQNYKDFRKLPGVGEYIAAAVQSIAFDQLHAVVDGNVKRVLARMCLIEAPVNDSASLKTFQQTASTVLDKNCPGDFNQAMMELGAMICRPQNPLCGQCPVSELCRAFEMNKQDEFPRRKVREKTPEYHIAVGVVRRGEQILITRRAESGLLGGLWEFPGGKVRRGEETAAETCVREIKEEVNVEIKVDSHLTMVRHAYTHFKIIMDVFLCDYLSGEVALNGPVDFKWITVEEIEQYPFPKGNHKFMPLLQQLNQL